MKLAGAYWRGNSDNEMPTFTGQRGATKRTQSPSKQAEGGEKRDHRKLGRKLDLFTSPMKRPAQCSGTPRIGDYS